MEVISNEIQLNADEFDEVIADTAEVLGLPKSYCSFERKVLPHFNHFDCMSEKEKFQKYAYVLQSHMHHLTIPLKRLILKE